MNLVDRMQRLLARLEQATSLAAAAMLFAIMLIVVLDVFRRYFFNSPLSWSYDLISMYLMVWLFFLSLSTTLEHNEHVRVDILLKHFPLWARHLAEAVTLATASVVFGVMVWVMAQKAHASFLAHEVAPGEIPWPSWLSMLAVPVGAGLMLLRMLLRLVGHVLSLATRRAVVDLPPLTGSQEPA